MLLEHFMLHGHKFILSTDHRPLLSIFGAKKGIPVHTANRLQRWARTLLGYDFNIEHISTTKFGHADVLSRLMQRDSINNEEYVIASVSAMEAEIHHVLADAVRALPLTSEMISKATADDAILLKVRAYMRTSWPDTLTEDIQTYYNRREALAEIGGCIILSERVIIPLKFQNKVLRQLHRGHPRIVRMKALARSYVYWPKIDSHIEQLVKQCVDVLPWPKLLLKQPFLHGQPRQSLGREYISTMLGHFWVTIFWSLWMLF